MTLILVSCNDTEQGVCACTTGSGGGVRTLRVEVERTLGRIDRQLVVAAGTPKVWSSGPHAHHADSDMSWQQLQDVMNIYRRAYCMQDMV
jgi:hypothetical protein